MAINCSDCYNGCVEGITSDKCIKYTGVNVPALDIKTGDSLSWVEQALITFLTATIDGSGIQITIASGDYCEVVQQYLQTCTTVTALDLFKALVKASCSLQAQVTATNATLTTLNESYIIGCLSGVVTTDDTHLILQAVITKLCSVDSTLTALATNVDTFYVKKSELDSLVAAYIAAQLPATRYYTRMVPYTAVEFYPTPSALSFFSATGVGQVGSVWEKIYICNGLNLTPDHRGRVGVGLTTPYIGIAFSPEVDPALPGNPAYTTLSSVNGVNTITLAASQIPAHSHTATTTVTIAAHSHTITASTADTTGSGAIPGANVSGAESGGSTDNTVATATAATTVADSTGGGLAHNNYQPGIGCIFIIYLP